MRYAILLPLVLVLSGEAHAENLCESYVGQAIVSRNFDAVAAALPKISGKSEFETTAQYEARKASILGNSNIEPVIIAKKPEGLEYFEYDADAGVLRISSYAFHNQPFNEWEAFNSAGMGQEFTGTLYSDYIDVVVSKVDQPIGTYEASNSFGAKANVEKIQRVTKVIFERVAGDYNDRYLFPSTPVGSITMTPTQAMSLKPTIKLALVVVPKEPFLVSGSHSVGEVTIRNPTDVTEKFVAIVGDIQCGLVTDPRGLVLGAYPTN